MIGTTLDTLRMVERLRAAGFDEHQAEAVTDALREARELDVAQLATKADLGSLRAAPRATSPWSRPSSAC